MSDYEHQKAIDEKIAELEKTMKPCPFCGRPGKIHTTKFLGGYIAGCSVQGDLCAGAGAGRLSGDLEKTVAYWNQRHDANWLGRVGHGAGSGG